MTRWVVICALLAPSIAGAQGKSRDADAPAVWPPPPDDDSPKKPAPKGKKAPATKDDKAKDEAAAAEASDAPLPRLEPADDDAPKAPPPPPEPPVDPCDVPFDECHETCTIDHTNDDTTELNGHKGLLTCLKRCTQARASCEERRKLGLTEKRRDDPSP